MTAVAERLGDCGHPLTGAQRKWCSPDCQREAKRAQHLAKIFALTPIEYDTIFAHQGGRCAICKKPPAAGKKLAVDHDHRTGLVRGILCAHCNLRVVARLTDPGIARATYEYLSEPPARQALGRDVVAPGRAKKKRTRRTRKARSNGPGMPGPPRRRRAA